MKELNRQPGSSRWTTERRRSLGLVFACLATAVVAACGGDGGPSGPGGPTTYKDPVGSYAIATINSKTLPAAVYSDTNYLFELVSGSSTLTSDGKYVNALLFRQTLPGSTSMIVDTVRGTWKTSGGTVQFFSAVDSLSNDTAAWANTGKLTFIEPHSGGGFDTLVYTIKK